MADSCKKVPVVVFLILKCSVVTSIVFSDSFFRLISTTNSLYGRSKSEMCIGIHCKRCFKISLFNLEVFIWKSASFLSCGKQLNTNVGMSDNIVLRIAFINDKFTPSMVTDRIPSCSPLNDNKGVVALGFLFVWPSPAFVYEDMFFSYLAQEGRGGQLRVYSYIYLAGSCEPAGAAITGRTRGYVVGFDL